MRGPRCSAPHHSLTEPALCTCSQVFWELEEKYGEIEEMNICDNLGDHLVGNVYCKFLLEGARVRGGGRVWFQNPAVRVASLSFRAYGAVRCVRGQAPPPPPRALSLPPPSH